MQALFYRDNPSHTGSILDTQSCLGDNYAKEIEIIRQTRKKRVRLFMLIVCGDESHDEKISRVFAVAGIAGTQEEWDQIEPIWNNRTGGIPFHAADCEAGRGQYEKNSHTENLKLYSDLVKILAQFPMMGFGATIGLQNFRECFPDSLSTDPYHWLFMEVVRYFASMGYYSIPKRKVNFTFDLNDRVEYSTNRLFEWIKSIPNNRSEFSSLVHSITFASRNESIGLQTADIFAREIMKHYDNFFIGPRKYNHERSSLHTLRTTQRYKFVIYSEQYLKHLQNKSKASEKTTGISRKYKQWLLKNKLNNNATNRIEFIMYFDSLDDGEEKPGKHILE